MIDQNGLPTAVETGFDALEKAAVLQTPEQPVVSFSSLLASLMVLATTAVRAVIDPVTRIFIGGTAGTDAVASITAALSEGTKKTLTLTPIPDQTGRSLKWQQTARESGFDPDLGDAIKAVVDAPTERPSYRVESLVAAILRAIPEEFQEGDSCPMIDVDQATGNVKVYWFSDGRNEAQGPLIESEPDDDSIKVVLEDSESGGGPAPLVFEGGET